MEVVPQRFTNALAKCGLTVEQLALEGWRYAGGGTALTDINIGAPDMAILCLIYSTLLDSVLRVCYHRMRRNVFVSNPLRKTTTSRKTTSTFWFGGAAVSSDSFQLGEKRHARDAMLHTKTDSIICATIVVRKRGSRSWNERN